MQTTPINDMSVTRLLNEICAIRRYQSLESRHGASSDINVNAQSLPEYKMTCFFVCFFSHLENVTMCRHLTPPPSTKKKRDLKGQYIKWN